MGDFQYEDPKQSKVPLITFGARIVTTLSLVASIIILKSDRITYKVGPDKYKLSYRDASSYQYVMFSMVVSFAYTVCQIPFAVYFLKTGKHLIKNYRFGLYDLFGDKLGLILLGTSVGAAFGVTTEFKRSADFLRTINGLDASDYKSKMDTFCTMAYLSAGFLLIGFISTIVSSIISSITLSKKS